MRSLIAAAVSATAAMGLAMVSPTSAAATEGAAHHGSNPALRVAPTHPGVMVGGYVRPAGHQPADPASGPGHRPASRVEDPGPTKTPSKLPRSVDLRPFAPAVGQQGRVASCVAWVVANSLMGYYANRQPTTVFGDPYAPMYLYQRTVPAGGAPVAGTNPDRVLAEAKKSGVDSSDDYWQGPLNYLLPPTPAQVTNARHFRVHSFTRLWLGPRQGAKAQQVIQENLAAGRPVGIGFPVFPDFANLSGDRLYDTVAGTVLGGHMVTIFGYDDAGVWVENQWGTSWGAQGWAHLSWRFVQQVVDSAYIISGVDTTDGAAGAPTVSSVSPTSGRVDTVVTIAGTRLEEPESVTFGGTPAKFSVSRTPAGVRLVVTVPSRSRPGKVAVRVADEDGGSLPSAAATFTYTAR